ncbi:hypothetical protein ABKN59_010774 [Abortiporus biennis]
MSSLAFINDLPPEILLKVFFQYIAAEDPGVDTNALEDDNRVRKHRGENLIHPLPPYHWIFLSHVCCYWRESGLKSFLLAREALPFPSKLDLGEDCRSSNISPRSWTP